MTSGRPPRRNDDDVVYLEEDGGDDVARALAEAERAVAAVEERHSKKHELEVQTGVAEASPPPAPGLPVSAQVEAMALGARISALEDEVATERERAVRAEEESGRMREALLRKTSDFENLKRRTEREKTDFFKFALAETFRDLLPILDNFERALAHGADAAVKDDFRVGIEMIARQLSDALRKYGLAEIPAQGLPFDPNVHEGVVREETESVPPGTVLDVLQKGYILNEKLLRPAMVKVAAAPGRSAEES